MVKHLQPYNVFSKGKCTTKMEVSAKLLAIRSGSTRSVKGLGTMFTHTNINNGNVGDLLAKPPLNRHC